MGETEEQELLSYFEYAHLPEHLQARSKPFADLAQQMYDDLKDVNTCQLRIGLQKLIEVKDCFVRAGLKKKG